jgi:serine/threonine-protein kinase
LPGYDTLTFTIFDYGEEQGAAYIATEFVDSRPLSQQLGQPLPADYVCRLLRPIASALDYAHTRGVVHRGVEPSNILIAADTTPVLADFGLAQTLGSMPRLTRTGTLAGTPEYMAPETRLARRQARRPISTHWRLLRMRC